MKEKHRILIRLIVTVFITAFICYMICRGFYYYYQKLCERNPIVEEKTLELVYNLVSDNEFYIIFMALLSLAFILVFMLIVYKILDYFNIPSTMPKDYKTRIRVIISVFIMLLVGDMARTGYYILCALEIISDEEMKHLIYSVFINYPYFCMIILSQMLLAVLIYTIVIVLILEYFNIP